MDGSRAGAGRPGGGCTGRPCRANWQSMLAGRHSMLLNSKIDPAANRGVQRHRHATRKHAAVPHCGASCSPPRAAPQFHRPNKHAGRVLLGGCCLAVLHVSACSCMSDNAGVGTGDCGCCAPLAPVQPARPHLPVALASRLFYEGGVHVLGPAAKGGALMSRAAPPL